MFYPPRISTVSPSDKLRLTQTIDTEIRNFCYSKGLLSYISSIQDMIQNSYRNVENIRLERIKHPEDSDYEKIRFEIQLRGDPVEILSDEKNFYNVFFREVPENIREYFLFTYWIL